MLEKRNCCQCMVYVSPGRLPTQPRYAYFMVLFVCPFGRYICSETVNLSVCFGSVFLVKTFVNKQSIARLSKVRNCHFKGHCHYR